MSASGTPDPRVAVAVVSYGTRDALRACLASARAERPAALVVADNGSPDGSAAMVAAEFPEATLLVDLANPGFGVAANRAVAACATPYVLLLNADTVLRPGAVAALARALDARSRAALVGPRLVRPDGALQPSCAPPLGSLRLAIEKSPLGAALARLRPLRERWLLLRGAHDRERAVPWVAGAALAIRRRAFDAVGGFDPGFFLYAEEVDLCHRLRSAGWEVRFTPTAEVVHAGGLATAPRRAALEVERVASARRFYRRHYRRAHVAALELAIAAAMTARWLRDAVRLRLTRDGARRARLAEDLGVWRRVLRAERAR